MVLALAGDSTMTKFFCIYTQKYEGSRKTAAKLGKKLLVIQFVCFFFVFGVCPRAAAPAPRGYRSMLQHRVTAAAKASISSCVLYAAKEARTVPSMPNTSINGCAQ